MHILRNHGQKLLGIVLLFFIPIILSYVLAQQVRPLENAFQSFSDQFQFKGEKSEWRDFDSEMSREKVTGTYSFKTVLPNNRWRDPHMYLSLIPNAQVYLEDELIYTYNPRFEYREHPHFIKLPDDFSGKTLMIRIDFDHEYLYPGKFFIDSPLQIMKGFVWLSDYRLLVGFVSLLVSIVGIILFVGRRQASYLYFSLFALYIAQLCVSRSWFLLGLFVPSPTFAYFQDVILPIGSYCFLQFYESVFGKGTYRIHRLLSKSMIVIFFIWLLMSLFYPALYQNEMSTLLQNIIAPGVIVVVLINSIRTYRKRQDAESFWFMAGIVTFSFTVLLYFLLPFFLWSSEQILQLSLQQSMIYKIIYNGDRFLHGMFILLFCMAMVLSSRIQSIYDRAQKTAEELTQLSASLEQLVQERTKELERTNENLRSSMKKTAEALAEIAVLEDRNRIAQDMHDHTGHALTGALIQIEVAKALIKKNEWSQALEKIEGARESVASGLESIRETVQMMKLDYEERSLVISIQHLIEETEEAVGVRVLYTPEPLPDMDPILKKALYLALQEGLTNGIRHGKAKHFQFSLKENDQVIYFKLANDGKRYNYQEFGFGLKTMRERIQRFNGTVQLEATDEHACVLSITLPIAEREDVEGDVG